MTTLTAQEIAEVAREVTGEQSYQVDSFGEIVTAWQERWDPDFSHEYMRMMFALKDRDIGTLMSLVLELKRGR